MTDLRRRLPAVNTLLEEASRHGLDALAPRPVLVGEIRRLLDETRTAARDPGDIDWIGILKQRVAGWKDGTLKQVINATGVVLHTNLGRAPLPETAVQKALDITGYSSLEYDLGIGGRGSRLAHLRAILSEITGAEDAIVTNNAASALLLVLNTLADGRETIVSRGELVEIGGSFRIPEILEKSGSTLREVGTTNRTRIGDYETAVSETTGCLLKVHRSNFVLEGFVCEASLEELRQLANEKNLPLVFDAGSGLLLDLGEFGLTGEPFVPDAAGLADLTVFSGDKLVGGPQAGIVVGRADLIARAQKNPLARALRPDKLTIAMLEVTLALYRDRETALREIPVLRLLTTSEEELRRRATELSRLIEGTDVALAPGFSTVGGGSFPGSELNTWLVTVPSPEPERLRVLLRESDPPVIARVHENAIQLDVRTVSDAQLPQLARAVERALREIG